MNEIKEIRKTWLHMNQQEFAEWLSMPIRTLQYWEQKAPPQYIIKLVRYKAFDKIKKDIKFEADITEEF